MANEGVLVSQNLEDLISAERIIIQSERQDLVQPTSFEMPTGDVAWEMKGMLLPQRGQTIEGDLVSNYAVSGRQPIDLSIEPLHARVGRVYLIRSAIKLRLKGLPQMFIEASPKSSIGRIDLHTRTVVDATTKAIPQFDIVPPEYDGYVYLYVIPKSFDVDIPAQTRLTQLQFEIGNAALDRHNTKLKGECLGFLYDSRRRVISPEIDVAHEGALLTLDLESYDCVGWWTKDTAEPINLSKHYRAEDFWTPIEKSPKGAIWIPEGRFGIFVTREFTAFPPFEKSDGTYKPGYCGVMSPYNDKKGELRAHYAGFFDPGFGCSFEEIDGTISQTDERKGLAAVLEIRSYENRILRHGDPICRMIIKRLKEVPELIYGLGEIGSNYSAQRGPRLAKYFIQD